MLILILLYANVRYSLLKNFSGFAWLSTSLSASGHPISQDTNHKKIRKLAT